MTDERMGERLWAALAALPRGSGIVFRHFATAERDRGLLFARIVRIARQRRLVLVGDGAARTPRPCPAHTPREAARARRAAADCVFVSPVFATRTHPGARPLGPLRAAAIARAAGVPAIALGGMTPARFTG